MAIEAGHSDTNTKNCVRDGATRHETVVLFDRSILLGKHHDTLSVTSFKISGTLYRYADDVVRHRRKNTYRSPLPAPVSPTFHI